MEAQRNLNGWVACRIPPADKVALKELAQDRGTTVSVVMRTLIAEATAAGQVRQGGQVGDDRRDSGSYPVAGVGTFPTVTEEASRS